MAYPPGMARLVPDIPGQAASGPAAGEATSGRTSHVGSSRHSGAISAVTIAAFAAPVGAYFWLIHHYGVNVVYLDQWNDVSLLGRSYAHTLTVGNLWAQHGEQRMLLPNVVMLLLGHLDHLNIVVEEYISGLLLCASAAFIVVAAKRRSASKSWIAYVPVPVLMLSLVQVQSTLFGFQLAWYFVILFLAATLFLLDRPSLTGVVLAAAIVTAVAGSVSSIQGLLIWPCGLLLLYQRRRSWRLLLVWCAAAVAMGLVYAVGYQVNQGVPPGFSGIDLPGLGIRSFFQVIGSVLGVRLADTGSGVDDAVLLFGVLIFVIAMYAVISRGARRDTSSSAPIGVALIGFGLLYALAFADARAFGGPATASSSQYTTFTILIVVGCYLSLLDSVRLPWRFSRGPWASSLASVVAFVMVGIVCLQVVLGTVDGIREARVLYRQQTGVAVAIAHVDRIPDPILQKAVAGPQVSPGVIRADARIMKHHHLSFFESQEVVAAYEREANAEEKAGRFRYTPPPTTAIVRPVAGQVLHGDVLIDGLVRSGVKASQVQFHLRGPAMPDTVIGTASRTAWGWMFRWHTTAVPNGDYQVQSVTLVGQGRMLASAPVSVRVENG